MAAIITVPAQVLRQVSRPVEKIDDRVLKILKDVEETLKQAKNPQGVGLAAPQIGVSLRLFMIRPDAKGDIFTFINPEITRYSQRQTQPTGKHAVYEGCLSLPNHYAPIRRSESVTVRYQALVHRARSGCAEPCALDPQGETLIRTETFSGFAAHVIQHEMDHLNGILFIDRVLEQNSKLFRVEGKDWVEIDL